MKHKLLRIFLICLVSFKMYDASGTDPVTPNSSPEARALLNYIYSQYGKKTLSGQMWAPWAKNDEIETVYEITGKYPAIRGQDYINESANKRENQLAIEWWKSGGIPTIMWHWGAPSIGEGYENSKKAINIDSCFIPGTKQYNDMWNDLKRIADHLTELRDANVPVLWRPMHECDGNWFWYGKQGGERFVRLWKTMFDYFTKERKLNNLIWVLCHSGDPSKEWDPGKAYYDLAGGDTYGKGIQGQLFIKLKAIHGETIPIPYHECGTLPDPDECFKNGITWSWWMLWHTSHLYNHNKDELKRIYNHDLVITRDELPNIMDYLNVKDEPKTTYLYQKQDIPLEERVTKVTDSNTALHLLPPDYPVPYGPMKTEEIIAVLNRIFTFLDTSTPARVIDRQSKNVITDLTKLTPDAIFEPGVFRLISYEWGVAYGAILLAGEVTGDMRFKEYTIKRMNLIGDMAKYFKSVSSTAQSGESPVRSVLDPRALDDAGSMCAAMIKTLKVGGNPSLRSYIDNYINYITNKQFRLADRTLARNRPLPNALWLDDLYMSIPALAQMGNLTGDKKYFDDAVKQVLQFSQRMFNKDAGLYMHGWIQEMSVHPEFYWARCNGWALLAMSELLDVLPEDHPSRNKILEQFRNHIKGIASYQSGTGFWHQLINRNDSYYETSSTAIFTYCAAHAINSGWIDARAYGPMAVLGWNAVQTKVNKNGEVEGTCVGTGMAFDPAFYYNRPVNVAAAHGYGPVMMAGAEMIKLLKNYQVVINDAAVMFYPTGTDWRTYK